MAKSSFSPKTLQQLEGFLNKYESPNSIKTSSALLGYISSIVCSPDYIETPTWIIGIWDNVGNDFKQFESEKEYQQFEDLCELLLADCYKKLDDYQFNDYFLGKYKINLTEWCQGFLRGRIFWTHLFGEIFENDEENKNALNIESFNSNEEEDSIRSLNKKEIAIKKDEFIETSPEEIENFDDSISKDATYHKTIREDELEEDIRLNALTFIGLVSLIGEPKLAKKDFGVLTVVDENTKAQIPLLINNFHDYLLGIAYDFIPEFGMEQALEDINREGFLSEYSEDEFDIFDSKSKSTKKGMKAPFQIPLIDRNAPCPCGSDKKFKKCCGNQ